MEGFEYCGYVCIPDESVGEGEGDDDSYPRRCYVSVDGLILEGMKEAKVAIDAVGKTFLDDVERGMSDEVVFERRRVLFICVDDDGRVCG